VNEVRNATTTEEKIDYVKELISSDNSQIKLHDFAIEEVHHFLSSTSEDSFAVRGQFSDQEFLERIASYELHTKDLSAIVACLSHWANENQLNSAILNSTKIKNYLVTSYENYRIKNLILFN